MKKRTFHIISVIVFLLAMAMLTTISVPLIKNFNNPYKFKEYIDSLGSWGLVVMFFIQISQIIVAFIPGEIVEFVAGTLFGWLGGLLFCLIGIAVGQFIVFKAVKFFGRDFVEKVAGSKIMNKYEFLHNEKKLKSVIFFLFIIPTVPKDLLTYFVPLTRIKLKEFLLITTLARIPSVITSTIAGQLLREGDYVLLAVVYGVTLIFTLLGIIIFRFISKKHNKKHSVKSSPSAQNSADKLYEATNK